MAGSNQVLEFVGKVLTKVPWGKVSQSRLQTVINDADRVAEEFVKFINNGGRVQVGPPSVLDLDADPHIPDGWSIRLEDQIGSHLAGSWEVDVAKINLYRQQVDKSIVGYELKKQLEGQKVLPAHVLDYLLEHPELIPGHWKREWIYFWGTVYRISDRCLCVRCLRYNGRGWFGYYSPLDMWLGHHAPAAFVLS